MSVNHPGFPESCRKCAAQVIISDSSGLNWYACGSAGTFQSATCAAREPLANELNEARTRIKELVEKVDETQAALDLSARQLLYTVNDRNSIGVQLDLLRDELLRIRARIGETGLIDEHPELSSIAGYCERAQKDIAVRYTPIQERDKLQREVRQLSGLRERAEERARRLEEAGDAMFKWSERVGQEFWLKAKEAKP